MAEFSPGISMNIPAVLLIPGVAHVCYGRGWCSAKDLPSLDVAAYSGLLCTPEQMPVLSGGLGALGVVTAQFLVEEGAKALCLLSRNGQPAKARVDTSFENASTKEARAVSTA